VFDADLRFAQLYKAGHEHRTVIGCRPLLDGHHYWEIVLDARSEPGIIIGVTLEKTAGKDGKSFCESQSGFGFAVYESLVYHAQPVENK
jgi:hypothetical protein